MTDLTPPPTESADAPRLTIVQMILMTVATAVLLTWTNAIRQDWPDYEGQDHPLVLLLNVISAIGCSLALLSPFWFWQFKKSTGKFFLHPGHWLLAIFAIQVASMQLAEAIFSLGLLDYELALLGSQVLAICLGLLGFILTIFAIIKTKGWWQLPLGLLLIPDMFVVAFLMWNMGNTSSGIVMAAAGLPISIGISVLICAALDLNRGEKRDWVHWIGILVVFLFNIISQALSLFWYHWIYLPTQL